MGNGIHKESGQTVVSDDLSALAPPEVEYLNLVWRDFKKLVRFIDDNKAWLLPLLEKSRGDRGSAP